MNLTVANSGSGSLSVLSGDGRGGFVRSKDITVGAGPVALASSQDGGDSDEIVVVASDGTVALVRDTSGRARVASRLTLPGGAAAQPMAVDLFDLMLTAPSFEQQVAQRRMLVAARGAGAVFVVPITANGRLSPPTSMFAASQPVAVLAGAFGGDGQLDVAVAEASGDVKIYVTPGDHVVDADPDATGIAASDGVLVWSRKSAPHEHRLARAFDGSVRDVPVAPSRRALAPHVGRARDGSPVVTYMRCGRDRCRPYEWSVRQEQERPIRTSAAPDVKCVTSPCGVAAWRISTGRRIRAAAHAPPGDCG